MVYDVIFPIISLAIPFLSLSWINLVLLIQISLSYSLLKRQSTYFQGKLKQRRKVILCISFCCNMLCNKEYQSSVSYKIQNGNFSLIGLWSALVTLFQALSQVPLCAMYLSCQNYLGFQFLWEKASRSELKKLSQTKQVHLKLLLFLACWLHYVCSLSDRQVIWLRPRWMGLEGSLLFPQRKSRKRESMSTMQLNHSWLSSHREFWKIWFLVSE